MTLALALLTEAAASGLTVRRRGTRIALVAPTPPPAALLKRLREAKPALLATLPDDDKPADPPFIAPDATDDDGPHQNCLCCGWRTFWRPSGTREPWQCGRCVSVPRNNWTDCVALPPKAGAQ